LIIFTARRLDRWGTRALGLVSLTGADADGEAEGSTTSDERGCLRRAAVWESECRLWLGVAMVWEEWCGVWLWVVRWCLEVAAGQDAK
jgi:hypothetical protein